MKNAGAEPPEESEQAFTSEFDEELEAELYHSSMTSESSCSCESCASSNYTSCSCGCNDPTHDEDDTEDCLGDQSEEQMSSLMTTSTGSNVTIVEQGLFAVHSVHFFFCKRSANFFEIFEKC